MSKFDKIKIKDNHWEIRLASRTSHELAGNLGMCCYDVDEIYIADHLKPDSRAQTLYHELSHAILSESDYNDLIRDGLGDNYERFVNNLGSILQNIDWDNVKDVEENIRNNND